MKNIVWRLLFTVFCLCNSLLLFGQKKIITADTISQNGKTYFVIPKNSDTLSYNNITYVVIPEMNYQMIGRVDSKLHSTSLPSDYIFADLNPVNGINFYRLKQVNADGKFNYSDIIAVKFDNPVISIITINPNPVEKILRIVCNANEPTAVNCNLYNSDGRLVKSIATNFAAGTNTISADVTALASGTYFIVLSRPNERITEAKFIKL